MPRWRFLAHEEAALAGGDVAMTGELSERGGAGARAGRPRVSLFQLYKWATRVCPKSNGQAYLHLWLGYARQQG